MSGTVNGMSALKIRRDRIASSLILQQLLHYQRYFAWCWFLVNMIFITYGRMPAPRFFRGRKIITFSFTLFYPIAETFIRIPLGTYGNLKEDISALFLFELLTFGLTMLIHVWMCVPQTNKHRKHYDVALNLVALISVFSQFVFAFIAMVRIVREQRRRFIVAEMESKAVDQPPKGAQRKAQAMAAAKGGKRPSTGAVGPSSYAADGSASHSLATAGLLRTPPRTTVKAQFR